MRRKIELTEAEVRMLLHALRIYAEDGNLDDNGVADKVFERLRQKLKAVA